MLPDIMPLLFPDFLYNGDGAYLGNMLSYGVIGFSVGINLSDSCQYSLIQGGGDCKFNNYRDIRGRCEADHFWPSSLGGPSIIENRILLCKFHNVAKSNSIMLDFWKVYPGWLDSYLIRMNNLKA